MDFKLKANANDDVEVIMKAGEDYVRTSMPVSKATAIISAHGFEVSDQFKDFPILSDGKFFEGTVGKAKSEPKAESKATDEPVKAVKKTTAKKKA